MNKVDYEKQKTYSLSLEGRDGGGRVSSIPLLVSLTDVNDNAPAWEASQYQRTVREGATVFQPQFFLRALDADKDGESQLRYKVLTSNSNILTVDEFTGEVKISGPVSSEHTSRGQYEMVVRVFDDGTPALHSDVPVFVRVGVPGNNRPVFRGAPYNATLPETAKEGDLVATVKATDPDGPDSAIQYRISNGADNFNINDSTGAITVSRAAILDPDVTSIRRYTVTVLAVDSGSPVRETAQTNVIVNIQDINNKPPYFPLNANYVRHISERTAVGKIVLKVQAVDPDSDADLEYSLVDIRAKDKTGVPVKGTSLYNYKSSFRVNQSSGEIIVNAPLNHEGAATIILTVQVRDKNSAIGINEQVAKAEITLYIQAYDEQNPKFTVGGWSGIDPIIRASVPEEKPVGSVVLRLSGIDPLTSLPISRFSLIPPVPPQLIMDSNGNIIINKRVDYENMDDKVISLRVEAISNDGLRKNEATILLTVEDINDHTPEFKEKMFKGSIQESALKNTEVLTVTATDGDRPNSTNRFGDIFYSLSGESAFLFFINSSTGEIKVSGNGTIDREKTSVLRLLATASDTPQGGANQRKASVPVVIEVEDVNDNAPKFSASEYTAVVLENVKEGTPVTNLSAMDLDIGPAGSIEYEIVHQADASGLFILDKETGQLKTKMALTGKGRTDPYTLTIRAQDLGEPSLFTDVPLRIYVGDIVSNDGIPMFIHPTLEEIAYISENSSIGSPVFRVVATDPDDPNTLEGRIRFSFLNDGADSLSFSIDSVTGLITTKANLDREEKDNYTLIVMAQDTGTVPQHASRQLQIRVTDIDDHTPVFRRTQDESPLEFSVTEETSIGTGIGIVEAEDLDIGENAEIGYLITYGNEDGLFSLTRLDNNSGIITVAGRLDRETNDQHLITVKCFKRSVQPLSLRKQYNKQDFSERQIKIEVMDIDDNLPKFTVSNITVGVRVNVPVDSLVTTVSAHDVDADSSPILYSLDSITFTPPSGLSTTKKSSNSSIASAFTLGNITGELRTSVNMAEFYDGFFTLKIAASNKDLGDKSYATIKVYVVRDRSLMKFIFAQPPGEVRAFLPDFKKEMEVALGIPASLNIYDTQFHAKNDGSLDFSVTSSCFQIVGTHNFDVKEMEAILSTEKQSPLEDVYKKYNILNVQRCVPIVEKAEVTWVQLCVLGIACFIGIASFISGCVLCCSYNRWQRIR